MAPVIATLLALYLILGGMVVVSILRDTHRTPPGPKVKAEWERILR